VCSNLMANKLHVALRIQDDHKTRNAIDRLAKALLALAQCLLSALAVFNVCIRSAPSDNLSRRVLQGIAADKKPAKYAIAAANATLHLEWLLRADSFLKCFQDARQVVRMNRALPAESKRLLQGEACVVQPALIEEVGRTVQKTRPRRCG